MNKYFLLIVLIFLNACGGVKSLKRTDNSPKLHDNYSTTQDERIYAVLPLPDGFDKDQFVKFTILRSPVKGEIKLLDDFKGFFYYTPKEGMNGYDYLLYKVSDGTKVRQNIVQIVIK